MENNDNSTLKLKFFFVAFNAKRTVVKMGRNLKAVVLPLPEKLF